MNMTNLSVAFYIRGETPRTINKQYLTLQQFCHDYQVPFEDVIVLKDVTKSDAPRPNLQTIMDGSVKIDVLVMQSYHILHIHHDQFIYISEMLSKLDISLLLLNEQEVGDAL
ncbi:hypothetical protein J2Z32_002962 [Paenibacillus turicensis]|uniref:Resolvase/invertase-type recombinase catalytic domain-containing protein n=1 Tax=Paenibacillus turicensis TaxID=160487 RepID=A0ABS4FVD3_9BACL|nr:hypothetical protein [Paenibacillus turicensis]MBP1906313.1 hypothetical protein [Paenibacillus turicensis]